MTPDIWRKRGPDPVPGFRVERRARDRGCLARIL